MIFHGLFFNFFSVVHGAPELRTLPGQSGFSRSNPFRFEWDLGCEQCQPVGSSHSEPEELTSWSPDGLKQSPPSDPPPPSSASALRGPPGGLGGPISPCPARRADLVFRDAKAGPESSGGVWGRTIPCSFEGPVRLVSRRVWAVERSLELLGPKTSITQASPAASPASVCPFWDPQKS